MGRSSRWAHTPPTWCTGRRLGLRDGDGAGGGPHRPEASARHLFLDRDGRPVRAALRRLQRALRSHRPDGRRARTGLPRLPILVSRLCLLILVLVYVLVARVSSSRFGLALRSLREDEQPAAAFGRDIYR